MIKVKLSEEQQKLYKREMEIIKKRTNSVVTILSEPILPNVVACEFVALQLRMIMEGIAMSSLVIHKDEYEIIYNDFKENWKAVGNESRPGILDRVKKINPYYYPKPQSDIVDGAGHKKIVDFAGIYLQEKDFLGVYNKLGSWLHARNSFETSNYRDAGEMRLYLNDLLKKIINLLNNHLVGFSSTDILYLVHMKTNISEDVQMYEFEVVKNC